MTTQLQTIQPLKHAVSVPAEVLPALVAALEAVHETSHETNNAA